MARILDLLPLRTGVSLAGQTTGPAGGHPVIFLHGYTNNGDSWREVLDTLTIEAPDLLLIALDARGHGRSTVPSDPDWAADPKASFTIPVMAADVLAYMDAVGIPTATIVGHSMGSLVAQEIALTAPERVTRLVLISTTSDASQAPILSDWLLNTVLRGQWRQAVETTGLRWPEDTGQITAADVLPENPIGWMQTFWNVYPYRPDKPTLDAAEHAAGLPVGVWLGAAEGLLDYTSTDRLPALTTPTLVLWGVQDAFFLRDAQMTLIAGLHQAMTNGGEFEWEQWGERPLDESGLQTDDLGHNLTWDDPDRVAGAIARFIKTGTVAE